MKNRSRVSIAVAALAMTALCISARADEQPIKIKSDHPAQPIKQVQQVAAVEHHQTMAPQLLLQKDVVIHVNFVVCTKGDGAIQALAAINRPTAARQYALMTSDLSPDFAGAVLQQNQDAIKTGFARIEHLDVGDFQLVPVMRTRTAASPQHTSPPLTANQSAIAKPTTIAMASGDASGSPPTQ
ncbi:MAG: hypothetical protein KGI79_02270 [Patescibacteria group bacterium]|nr:hypothetical protein [Patescibacteria group bacterium]MDE2116677.1 hypothetical protein [Patescibacteria group bacterium]